MSLGLAIAMVSSSARAWAQAGPEPQLSSEAQPGPEAQPQPPVPQAQAPTRARFVSTTWQQWDVLVDGQVVCSTPCSGPLFPQQLVLLYSRERRPAVLEVGHLPPGDFVVSGKPLQRGMHAGGVVTTTLGGMAMAIGITLVAIGLAKDRDGMTIAGAIAGGAGVLALPAGIYLMVNAVPSVTVARDAPSLAGAAAGISGTF